MFATYSCICLDTLKPVFDISNSCSLVLQNETSNFGSLQRIFLNLCLPAVEHRDEWLRNLKLQQIVFDPDPLGSFCSDILVSMPFG